METLMPRTMGANTIAVPNIMSVMDFSRMRRDIIAEPWLWYCLPRITASLPASSLSLSGGCICP